MKEPRPTQSHPEAVEAAALTGAGAHYKLRLYIAGPTPQSTRAIVNIRRICEEHLKDRYELDVLDLLQNPMLAREDQIIAAPTLAKILPLPARRLIGDLSQRARLLTCLDLSPPPDAAATL